MMTYAVQRNLQGIIMQKLVAAQQVVIYAGIDSGHLSDAEGVFALVGNNT